MANMVHADPDQTAPEKHSDLSLPGLLRPVCPNTWKNTIWMEGKEQSIMLLLLFSWIAYPGSSQGLFVQLPIFFLFTLWQLASPARRRRLSDVVRVLGLWCCLEMSTFFISLFSFLHVYCINMLLQYHIGYRWINALRFYVLFNSTSVISERWFGDKEWLCAMELHLRLERLPPRTGLEPGTARSVGQCLTHWAIWSPVI